MRVFAMIGAAALAIASAGLLSAAEVQSGVEVGGKIGAYSCTKVAGCEDGVEVGKSLCYTWKLGGRPVVFIFAKTPSEGLASLASEIDKVAAANEEKKMAGVINFSDEPSDEYLEKIKEFGEKLDLKHVAVVISKDGDKFKVNEDADVTVMHYKGKKVAYNFAGDKDSLNKDAVKEIVEGTSKILE